MAAAYATALLAVLSLPAAVTAQSPAEIQLNTFNSSAKLSSTQIKNAGLEQSAAKAIEIGLNFERSNWASESVFTQPFYKVPANASSSRAGSLLKKEDYTNTTAYTIPPQVSLSRFIFQSETLNGTTVPASAYILWPYTARKFRGIHGVPVVAFAHGNSGWNSECAPTHIRNLWYQYHAPFDLALAGYAVIAPDYAGLGVNKDADGKPIPSQWFANPAEANDLMYAVEAAQKGWPELSKEFVVMGHSQGGGAAWGAAQRQHLKPVDGYLGTIAVSPLTSLRGLISPQGATVLALGLSHVMQSIFKSFKPSDFLNSLGLKRLKLMQELSTCNSANAGFYTEMLNTADWDSTWYIDAFDKLTSNGGRRFKGPLLILQGDADETVREPVTTAAVKETCNMFPKHRLQYIRFEGADHVPTLYASRMVWMDWIADRFKGVEVPIGCFNETVTPLRAVDTYHPEINYFLEYAQYSYEVS